MATLEKPFATCTLKYIDKTFQTRRAEQLPSLDAWLTRPAEISAFEREALLRFQRLLNRSGGPVQRPRLERVRTRPQRRPGPILLARYSRWSISQPSILIISGSANYRQR